MRVLSWVKELFTPSTDRPSTSDSSATEILTGLMRSDCERLVGHKFKNASLLDEAMTHSSRKSENIPCNERFEFLGDSVLSIVISEYLFREFPEFDEGELTAVKSVVVSKDILARASSRLSLERFLQVGRGLAAQKRVPNSLLANAFEAVVAAIFLDAGMEKSRDFILTQLKTDIDVVLENEHHQNFKSLLQQYSQKEFRATPTYRVLQEKGPEHGKSFLVVTMIRGKRYEQAWGRTKKEAEQTAAGRTLKSLGAEDSNPEPGRDPSLSIS